ncbi:MAG: phage tail tape measure protein [Oscillospiraceae bacterium]|nr:phage tail tape measure protein [Oscillospiraceae bacterium]
MSQCGEDSPQIQKALIDLETAERHLEEAQKDLTTAQQGTIDTISTGKSAFVNENGSMKSLGEIMNILRENLKAVDVELVNSEGEIRDYDDIISELEQSEEGLAQAEQIKNAGIIFGKQNIAGMLAIINASEKDYNKLTEAIYNSDGAAKDMADTMIDNLGGDLTILKSKLQAIQIAIYEKFEPALRKIAEKVGEVMNTILEKIDVVSPVIENAVNWVVDHSAELIATIAGVATAVGTFMLIINKKAIITAFTTGISTITKAFGLLNTTMLSNPIGLVIAAIAGLVAAFVVLWNKSDKFRNFWIGLWESIKSVFSGFIDSIIIGWETIASFFSDAWDSFKVGWNSIIDFFKNLWDSFQESFQIGMDSISNFFHSVCEKIKNFFQPVITFFTEAWAIIGELAQGCSALISAIWEKFSEWLNTNIITPIKNLFESLFTSIKDFALKTVDNIKTRWEIITTWFNDFVITPIQNFFEMLFTGIKNFALTAWDNIKTGWKIAGTWFNNSVITPIKNFFVDMWNGVKNGAVQAWEGIKKTFAHIADWFEDKFATAWQKVKNVFSAGGEIFAGIKEGILSAFKNVVNGLIRGINTIIAVPFNAINDTLDRISTIDIGGFRPFENLVSRFSVPEIPMLAKGGIVNKPTIAKIGEAGAEAIIPLERNKAGLQMLSKLLTEEMQKNLVLSANAYGNTGTNVVNNNYSFTQHNTSPKALSRSEIYRQTKNLIRAIKRGN